MAKTENLVVMFTDIVGFTQLTASQSREENEAMLRQNEKLLNGVARQFGGKRIKSIGDALLIVFKSPTDAVHCAMAMHDALWEYNQSQSEEERVTIRVALNSGEVRIVSNDVFGEPVNVASRLEGVTPADEVYFTESIYLSMNKAEVGYELVGKQKLRGIPDEVTIYRVPRGVLAPRLVAVATDDPDAEKDTNKYPYGGMHKIEKPKGMKMSFPIPWKSLAAVILLGVAIAAGIKYWPLTKVATEELTELLDSDNIEELKTQVDNRLDDNSEDALALFMRAHIAMDNDDYEQGLKDYKAALTLDPSLADDERYADNFMKAMPENGPKVTELAKLSPSEPLVDRLAERSVEAGMAGRRDAAYILRIINRQDRMDSVAMAMWDLQESESCEDKLAAVQILHDRKDPRALPVLRESIKTGIVGLFKKNCLRKPVRRAIAAIEG